MASSRLLFSSLALRVVGVVAAGAAVAAAAGCTTSAGPSSAPLTGSAATTSAAPAAPASTASVAPPASSAPASSPAQPSASASPAPPSSPAPTPPGAAAGCATRDLQVKAGVSEGAAGSVYQVIDFTNIGSAACTLYGYPGVSLAVGTPATQVGAAASRSTAAGPTLVTLSPGQTGNALLRITQAANYPAAKCSPKATTYLQIYPPNQTTPVYLPYSSTGCSLTSVNLVTIGVVQAGSGSSGA